MSATGERSGVLLLVVGSTIISFSAVFVKLVHVGPTAAGVYRNLFGSAVLFAIVLVRRESLWQGAVPAVLTVAAALFFAADIFCWHRSVLYIGPGLATIMGNFQVFFLSLAGIFIFRERITWQFVVSVPLALVGLFLLVGIDWKHLPHGYRVGVALGVITAVTYAGYLLTLRASQRRSRRLAATPNLALITAATALMLFVAARVQGESLAIPDTRSWVVLIAYGAICQAIGWIIISRALRQVDASRVGLVLLLQPTLTFIWDILFFDRPTTSIETAGALIAVAAIYLGNRGRGAPRKVVP